MPNTPAAAQLPPLPKQPTAVKNPAPATMAPMPGPIAGQSALPSLRNLNSAQPLPQPVIPSMARLIPTDNLKAPTPVVAPATAVPVPAVPPNSPAALPRTPQPAASLPQSNMPSVPLRPPAAPSASVRTASAPGAAQQLAGGSGNGVKPPTQAAPPASPVQPQPAAIKKSPFRFLPIVVILLLVLGLGGFLASRFLASRSPSNSTISPVPTTKQVTLTYWGLWEPTGVMSDVIADYEKANPGVKIAYQQQSYKDYRERLQAANVAGTGPDIFRFHASWTPMMSSDLSPMPSSVYTPEEFASHYYQVASDQLTVGNNLVGIPLMYDGLALYYNTDVLRTANASPPTTWADLKKLAVQLTIRSASRRIERAGLAAGNAVNVEHFSDIIALLMLQNGADLRNPNSQAAQEAIKFYTDFYNVDKVWDETLPSSTVAFARGEAAMMIAPSWRVAEIKAQNPNLNFAIAPVPQLSARKVTWASYWAEGVNQGSKNKAESWKFLKYLSSPATLRKFYSSASAVRPFGEIYPQREMVGDVASDPYVAAYLVDAPLAQGGFMSSYTHDNGLNDQIIKYYEDAVTALNQGKLPPEVMTVVQQGTDQVLRQYGLAPPAQLAPATP